MAAAVVPSCFLANSFDMDASTSQARWELENNVENTDEYLKWDPTAASTVVRQAPWKTDPKYYKK